MQQGSCELICCTSRPPPFYHQLAEYDARRQPTDHTTRKLNEISSFIAYLYRAAAVAQNRASVGR